MNLTCDTGDGCKHGTDISVDCRVVLWDGNKLLVARLKYKLAVISVTTLSQVMFLRLLGCFHP